MHRRRRRVTRREFLEISGSVSVGLLLGCRIGAEEYVREAGELTAWIHVASDGMVTIHVSESEMGQGILTSFAMILADEMEADWSKVRAVHALADRRRFGWQQTDSSTSIRVNFGSLRAAGAAAREMLIGAAAALWGVPTRQCMARQGTVVHEPSGRSARFGELAELAGKQRIPRWPRRKKTSEFRLIGRSVKRLDSASKADGSAQFGIDVRVPNMLVAVIAHAPVFGGVVEEFNARQAREVPGVRDVVEIPTGVAVVADHVWSALSGRRALDVTWDDRGWGNKSTDDLWEALRDLCPQGTDAKAHGSPHYAFAHAHQRVEAVYHAPYLAHATMEPMNCVADVRPDTCEIWVGTQAQSRCQETAAEVTGLSPDQVVVHTMYLGGGFGRRANTEVVAEAVHASKAVGRPVKVVYTREDDTRRGWYRPLAYNEMLAALDEEGWPTAWVHRIAAAPGGATDGAANIPYQFRSFRVTYAGARFPVPTWQWRAVGNTQNCYVVECFLDELARAGGKDPVDLRLRLLRGHPRQLKVVQTAAEQAGWGRSLPEGRRLGIAHSTCFGSVIAQVAEVSLSDDGTPRVHRVVCVIDCGDVVNPDTVRAQMESGIVYGLSAALYGQITIENGGAVQSNFHDYRILQMREMPVVETHIVRSGARLGGIGETATPPIVPAVCNAIFALTGKPVRKLPIVGSQTS
jgi:isoquinoline 1-oxidoreductase beta subunit